LKGISYPHLGVLLVRLDPEPVDLLDELRFFSNEVVEHRLSLGFVFGDSTDPFGLLFHPGLHLVGQFLEVGGRPRVTPFVHLSLFLGLSELLSFVLPYHLSGFEFCFKLFASYPPGDELPSRALYCECITLLDRHKVLLLRRSKALG